MANALDLMAAFNGNDVMVSLNMEQCAEGDLPSNLREIIFNSAMAATGMEDVLSVSEIEALGVTPTDTGHRNLQSGRAFCEYMCAVTGMTHWCECGCGGGCNRRTMQMDVAEVLSANIAKELENVEIACLQGSFPVAVEVSDLN